MIANLEDYFMPEQEFYLDKITYNKMDEALHTPEYSLNCIDNIGVGVAADHVKVTVKRVLQFKPEQIFELSVSCGVILKFKEEKKGDYDWEKLNLAEEFRDNGQFVINNLMNQMSLLIGEITACFGQAPILLRPEIAPKNQ